MNKEEIEIVRAMETYGGSFVKALAQCYWHADPENFSKLQFTFRGYWEQYEEIANQLTNN